MLSNHLLPISTRVAIAEARAVLFAADAEDAYAAGDFAKAERLFAIGLRWRDRANALRGEAWRSIRPRTGKAYLGRGGMKIGPLRPFRDEEDGDPTDAEGRDAWFFAEKFGGFDRYGRFLSGHPGDHAFDCIGEYPNHEGR